VPISLALSLEPLRDDGSVNPGGYTGTYALGDTTRDGLPACRGRCQRDRLLGRFVTLSDRARMAHRDGWLRNAAQLPAGTATHLARLRRPERC
jgi:hypothetical protein